MNFSLIQILLKTEFYIIGATHNFTKNVNFIPHIHNLSHMYTPMTNKRKVQIPKKHILDFFTPFGAIHFYMQKK